MEMTAEAARTVVVGVRMDSQSKELLTWALVKVAETGDKVVALHVLTDSSFDSTASSWSTVVKEFDSMLAVYEGFCNLKQIDLKMKISRGSAIGKVLVREATCFGTPMVVIIGVTKNNRVIGSFSTSIAKYCARKLPGECPVVAVNNGKIVFQSKKASSKRALVGRAVHGRRRTRASEKIRIAVSQQWVTLCFPVWNSTTSAAVHPDQRLLKTTKNGNTRRRPTKTYAVPFQTPIKGLEKLREKHSSSCRLFSYEELATATSNFSAENLIGSGGASRVYKARLLPPDVRELAVKKLNRYSEDAVKEFISEIEIIVALLHHKNIISLVGFCFDNQTLLLVYDLLPRGSLEHNLAANTTALSWAERYKVAMGVAEALDYLHTADNNGPPIIHRDVKSSNILLSNDSNPLLSDFGLASWSTSASSSTHLPTRSDVAGTFGYLAPEYFVFGRVNVKIDVYAYGVVLLELISGRKPIDDDSPREHQSLVMWAKPSLQTGRPRDLLDSRLGEIDDDQLQRMALAASLCTRRSPKLRPKMALILRLLEGDESTIKWVKSQLGGSEEQLPEEDEEFITYPAITDIGSHLSLALLDVEEDVLAGGSSEDHGVDYITAHGSLEAYLLVSFRMEINPHGHQSNNYLPFAEEKYCIQILVFVGILDQANPRFFD